MIADKFVHPLQFTGDYLYGYWAGYRFKDVLTYGTGGLHTGVDYNFGGPGEDEGMSVKAIGNGEVMQSTVNGFGEVVIIRHELPAHIAKAIGAVKYIYSRSMHLQRGSRRVKVGDKVTLGQEIGLCGKTGTASSHTHLDIWHDANGLKDHMEYHKHTRLESYVDPYKFIEAYKSSSSPVPTPPTANLTGLKDYQRIVAIDGLNYRREPNTKKPPIKTFNKEEILDFDGYINGENFKGNSLWFRGRYTGGFIWSGGVNSASTKGLVDLNPKPTPAPKPPAPAPVPDPVQVPAFRVKNSVVVNKKNPMDPQKYSPELRTDVGNGILMDREAGNSFVTMVREAREDGVTIIPASGLRSYTLQESVYQKWVNIDGKEKADTYSARPGFSEHQTGLAIDLSPINESFEATAAYSWLIENGPDHGFIERYPKGSEDVTGYIYEPWHFRYIGAADATKMILEGAKTLEEFYNVPGGLYEGQIKEEPKEPTMPVQITPEAPTAPETPEVPTVPTTPAPAKPGLETTEFWGKTIIQILTAGLAILGQLSPELAASVIGALEAVYAISRTVIKSLQEKAKV